MAEPLDLDALDAELEAAYDWDGTVRALITELRAARAEHPEKVTVLHIDSADTLVVFHLLPNESQENAQRIVETLRASLPPALKCLVIDGGVAITVASASDVTKATP